jgi:hypothetical protein
LSRVSEFRQVAGTNWIGGLDLNASRTDNTFDGQVRPIMAVLSLNRRLRTVEIGDVAKLVKVLDT